MKTFYVEGHKLFRVECDQATLSCPVIKFAQGTCIEWMESPDHASVNVSSLIEYTGHVQALHERVLEICAHCGENTR